MTVFDGSVTASRVQASTPFADFVNLLARVLIGWIFVMSGWEKLMNYNAAVASIAQRGAPQVLAYLAPFVEFISGVAVILGIMTEYAAILMFVFTIAATLTSHRFWQVADPAQYRAQSTNFWKNVSMMGGMLLLFVTGGGRFSVDALFRRR